MDGYIREQSPYTVIALMRQRRRWFCGLRLLAHDPTIRWCVRLPLAINIFVWSWMWVGVLATAVNVMAGDHYFPLTLRMLASVGGAATAAVYLVGAYRNQRDVDSAMLHKIRIYAAILVLMPVMGVIENAAVVWALLKPVKGFDVVDKN